MTWRFDGKVAVVTGAGRGIGRGLALELGQAGASVGLIDRDVDGVCSATQQVLAGGGRAKAWEVDVGDRASVARCVDEVVGEFGRLDFVINNACAAVTDVALVDLTEADMDVAWRSGALGSLWMMQCSYPHLRMQAGAVVNFGSIAGPQGFPGCGGYGPAKEAIRALTKVAAREWGRDGIRVNAICPNADTEARRAWREANPEAARGAGFESVPLGRLGDVRADIGRAVMFLLSEDAAYVTGHTLMVDGGSCAW